MPARSCSATISRSRSFAMRWKSAIMASIWATLRRFSSSWNFFRRMSVLRDFIDPYSRPEPNRLRRQPARTGSTAIERNGASILLVFGFQGCHDLLESAVAVRDPGRLLLGLGQERLQRLVQEDGLVDLLAGPRPIGPEPDQLLHVRIGRHHLA